MTCFWCSVRRSPPRPLAFANGIARFYPLLPHLRFFSIPRIRTKPDRSLDVVADRDKILRPFFRIMDLILHQDACAIKVRHLEMKRWELAIKSKSLTVKGFMKRYPNIFVLYTDPNDQQPWCKLTEEAMKLVQEERQIYRDTEPRVVETLRRLLLMATGHRIRADKLVNVRRIMGFPDDFLDRVVLSYPQYFAPVRDGSYAFIKLQECISSPPMSVFERDTIRSAIKKGLGNIDVNGKPFPFKIALSPGMALRKKNLEILEAWQSLPYMSPYHDWSSVKKGTPLSEKRLVGLLHEFLCLTIEKKARLKVIQPFRDEFQLPQKVIHLFERFPGVFYTSHRGGIKTIILREGYKQSTLIEDHPIVHFKEKFIQMVNEGRRALGCRSQKESDSFKGLEEVDDMEDEENSHQEVDETDSEDDCSDMYDHSE